MQIYCLKCKKHTETGKVNVVQTKNGKYNMKGKCLICSKMKSKFISKQQASGIVRSIARTVGKKLPNNPLSKIPILGPLTDLIY